MSTALLTDKYEFTMLSALIEAGRADCPATFELFARRLPRGRRFGLLAGLGRLLDALEDFKFGPEELDELQKTQAITPAAVEYLTDWRFAGNIDAYREGENYWPYSPVLTVAAPLGDAILIETLALSIFNHDTAIASAAARMVLEAKGRPLIEMGSRRTHERSALAAARAAWIAGFASTSNVEAGREFGIPTAGTTAHSFMLAFPTEKEAFAAQIASFGRNTTLLVDTFDIEEGIRTAIEVAGPGLAGIRIDSGDPAIESRRARALLDSLGATNTRVTVTSDLDEYLISALSDSPINSYGVGTRLVTGSGHPTASMVYKLVSIADEPGGKQREVAKKSESKGSQGGRKTAFRYADGREAYRIDGVVPDGARPLQVRYVSNGEIVERPTAKEVREYAAQTLSALSEKTKLIGDGEPMFTATRED